MLLQSHMRMSQNQIFTTDGWQTPTVVDSHTHTPHPKKIGLRHDQAIEVLMIVILFFTAEDREKGAYETRHILSHRLGSQQRVCAA